MNKGRFRQLLAVTITTVASGLLTTPALARLSLEEINSIARQTTVMIAPGLTPSLIEEIENNRNNPNSKEGVWNPGSGVIVARQGKTYYVLTVAHNFPQRYLDRNSVFGIRTSDRRVYVVTSVNDGRGCPLTPATTGVKALLRFGCRLPGNRIHGIDLAMVTFESDQNYPIASLGDASQIKEGDPVYISGWPDPEKELDMTTRRCRGRVAQRQRRLAWGPIGGMIPPQPQSLGYALFYTDNTRAGMSGGPVFDQEGRLVGVHGLGSRMKGKTQCKPGMTIESEEEVEEEESTLEDDASAEEIEEEDTGEEDEEETESTVESNGDATSPPISTTGRANAQPRSFARLNQSLSGSQQLNYSLSLIAKAGWQPPYNRQAPDRALIDRGKLSGGLPGAAAANGKVEFDARSDALEDPEDTIDNIYDAFSSLEARLRDCSTSVLLGNEDECGRSR